MSGRLGSAPSSPDLTSTGPSGVIASRIVASLYTRLCMRHPLQPLPKTPDPPRDHPVDRSGFGAGEVIEEFFTPGDARLFLPRELDGAEAAAARAAQSGLAALEGPQPHHQQAESPVLRILDDDPGGEAPRTPPPWRGRWRRRCAARPDPPTSLPRRAGRGRSPSTPATGSRRRGRRDRALQIGK